MTKVEAQLTCDCGERDLLVSWANSVEVGERTDVKTPCSECGSVERTVTVVSLSDDAGLRSVVDWANREIDEILHTGYTCDPHGDRAGAKDDGRKEALKEVLDRLGEPYEHDPDTCLECQLEAEIMEETGP